MGNRKINNIWMYYVMVYILFIKHNNIQQFHATYNNTGYQIDIKTLRDSVGVTTRFIYIYIHEVRSKPSIVLFNIYFAVYDTDVLD